MTYDGILVEQLFEVLKHRVQMEHWVEVFVVCTNVLEYYKIQQEQISLLQEQALLHEKTNLNVCTDLLYYDVVLYLGF